MRVGIIDLGTNTFNLLIVDVAKDRTFQSVYNTKEAVKIGEGAMIKNMLQPVPIRRGKRALAGYLSLIEEHNCDKTFAFATSGIRSTNNGQLFVDEVYQELGLKINVIDGDEEANLIYDGVDLAVSFTNEPMVVMDIGGGSTEFIIADESCILWKRSYKLGISRILQMLEPSDPLTQTDFNKLNALLFERLEDLIANCSKFGVKTMVGSSGSFDSFIEMLWRQNGVSKLASSVVSEEFDLDELRKLHNRLISYDYDQRKQIPGLVEMRVDTIHMASYMVQWVLQHCSLERLLLSSYALKEGVLHRVMENRI